ncbi:hypothetical protein KL86PLE_10152 [uncultured Pleomorphomonas sp.]|uniref:Uncharacterized protein n=1 Tax=uncultured Pleomorphomonas sp. TaxID=442121 RepID=A0A212KYQ2_9HYPH|nr:hypothetical protein [uncultured Pleomorphomonas sp.]SCM70428.1 hypothetical protein KL86PLE_10152 [uncultured Pleomorphomonas sp.]
MQDILTFFITRESFRRSLPTHTAEADQRFYDTAAPLAGKVRAAWRRLARWRHRLPRQETTGI